MIFFISASALLNWSYQNTKPCEVLVGGNTQVLQTSKAVPSDTTNLSTSTRPKTPSTGGKLTDLVFSRKRRQVDVNSHVFNVTETTKDFSTLPSKSSSDVVHDDIIVELSHEPLHQLQTEDSPLITNLDKFNTTSKSIKNNLNQREHYSYFPVQTSEESSDNQSKEDGNFEELTTIPLHKSKTQLSPDQSDEEENISDLSLFKLDSEAYAEIQNEHEFLLSKQGNSDPLEIQQDAPLIKDDIQFFAMGRKHISSNQKAKTLYNSDQVNTDKKGIDSKELTESNLSVLSLNNDENLKKYIVNKAYHSSNDNNTLPTKNPLLPTPKISYIEVHPNTSSMNFTNRLVLNITVATGFENNMSNPAQPVYVLSMLIPTDGINQPSALDRNEITNNLKTNSMSAAPVTHINDSDIDNSGGTCECSCPCLDSPNDSSESTSTEDYDIFNYINLSDENTQKETIPTEKFTISSFLSTDEDISTESISTTSISTLVTEVPNVPVNCSRYYKPQAPPPILILEGRKPRTSVKTYQPRK